MHITTKSRWHTSVSGLLPGIAWGLLVLALTLALLVLGAIVLPAQAHETSKPKGENHAFSRDER